MSLPAPRWEFRRPCPIPSAAAIIALLFGPVCSLTGPAPDCRADEGIESRDDQIERIPEVFRRIRPAIVRIRERSGGGGGAFAGVIVSADGHLLMSTKLNASRLWVTLSDGREVQARPLGWSGEWGVRLGRLEGDGPWPHTPLEPGLTIRAGQPLLTVAFALNEDRAVPDPLVDLEWVDRASQGVWFARPNGVRYVWQSIGGLAFDLEGRLLGIENSTFLQHGTIYTPPDRVLAAWDELKAGENVDRLRLSPAGDAAADVEPRPAPVEIAEAAETAAIAASVRISNRADRRPLGVSGTIISPDGLIATCAHHFAIPGTPVVVELADGRDLPGEVVGLTFPTDIGLVRITEPGTYPAVKAGSSHGMRPGAPCFFVGYGPAGSDARAPVLRRTQAVAPRNGEWSYLLSVDSSLQSVGGDSGGGLFNGDGELVAFSPAGLGYPDWPKEFVRVEALASQDAALRAPFESADVWRLQPLEAELLAVADRGRSSVIEVLDGDDAVALGTVVGSDGLILTKASALPETPRCRLADGRIVEAGLVRTDQPLDLALLRADVADLSPAVWSEEQVLAVGRNVVVAGPHASRGTVAHPLVRFEGDRGLLGVDLADGERGPAITALRSENFLPEGPVFGFGRSPLREGDIIRSVAGHEALMIADLRALLDPGGAPPGFAGDRVRIGIERDGQAMEVTMTLRPADDFPLDDQTPRRSGLEAYGILADRTDPLFGGPVVNARGEVVGIAIASRQKGWTLMLPASAARQFVDDAR
ncbi:MAG: trypsin-like peptidase domain-containing protein [Planctomyces sp.]|nr:trypsin-like peptidase domain-containing protein [Planctomyces sp.]